MIAVHDPALVRERERTGHATEHRDGGHDAERSPLEHACEIGAVDPVHGEERRTTLGRAVGDTPTMVRCESDASTSASRAKRSTSEPSTEVMRSMATTRSVVRSVARKT